MTTKTKTLTAIAVVLAAIPAISWAQQGSPMRQQPPQIDFATADADASGGISSEEWSRYVTEQMTARRAEAMGTRADALIEAGDANGDAALTRDELIAGFTALGEQRREDRGERGDRGDRGDRAGWHGHGQGHGHGRWGRGDDDRGRGDWGRMDRGDRSAQIFERMDQNEDGQIDAEELTQMQEHMQRRMGGRMGRNDN
ncbi:hypothetical protein [Pararhodobacter sp.]|uniref:hypothetical protein n=1 Tax=Pararhodobacter sp. TaxID=2127056 RepID=UPI002AFEB9B0|nr:hypothetical protein [Pararhodobacter sp.]